VFRERLDSLRRAGNWPGRSGVPFTRRLLESLVHDVLFVLLVILVFAILALIAKGAEKL